MKTSIVSGVRSLLLGLFTATSLFNSNFVNAQNCTLPNNSGQCSGGQGQIAVGGANITNNDNYWSSINRTVTGTVKVNNGGRLTVCSGVLTLNDLDMSGGRIVVLQGATLNIQNAHTLTGASEVFNYGTINYNNNVTLQGNDSRIYNHATGIINVASPFQLLINNNAQVINANVINVHTLNLNVNNPNPNAVCMGVNSVLLATNVIDQTSNNNGISGLTNSCVSVGSSYTANNTSSTSDLLVCIDENATGSGSFGQATPTNQCTSCGVLQSNALTLSLTGSPNANPICVGITRTLNAAVSFLPFGMQYQWGTGAVGTNIIANATSSSLAVTPSQTTTYWVRLVESANPANASTSSATLTLTVNSPVVSTSLSNTDMVWNGRVSTNWNNLNNWLVSNNGILNPATALPQNNQNVVIPTTAQTCVVNNPSITNLTRTTKNLTIESGAVLTMTGGVLDIFGDFTNNGTFTPGTNQVVFKGALNQQLTMNSNSNTFYNLAVDKSGGEVVLQSNIKVTNEINMLAKNIKLNSLVIDLGMTGNVKNESETSQIYCFCPSAYIQKTAIIPSNTTVQPGNLGITFTTHDNQMGLTVIKRRHVEPGTNGLSGLGTFNASGISRIYDVSPEFNADDYAGNLNVDVNFVFTSLDAQNITVFDNLSFYRSQDQGSSWSNLGFNSVGTNSLFIQGITGFSWLTVGPDDQTNAPLPIELLYFDALAIGAQVALNWATATEQNNDFFTVERSADGLIWEEVLVMNGAGTSIHKIDYSAVDSRPLSGLSYYRLKQTDYDGQFSYSTISSVFMNSENKSLLYVVNTLGQKVDMNTKGLVIMVFSNGETVKVINE